MSTTNRKGTIDVVFIIILFIVSMGIHYYYVTYLIVDITDKMQLFPASLVHSQKTIEYMPHGAAYVYANVLNFLCYVVGNKILVPIMFQIVLKMLGFFILFFALRMSIGKICAFISITILLFLPINYELLNQITPVVMSVFFICLQYFFFSYLLKGIHLELFKNYGYGILFIFYGILSGFIIFLDVLGLFFLIVSIIGFLFLQSTEPHLGFQNKVLQIVSTLLGTIMGLLGICSMISSTFGMSFKAPYVKYFYDYILNISLMDYLYFGVIISSILIGLLIQIICRLFSHSNVEEEEDTELEEDIKEKFVVEDLEDNSVITVNNISQKPTIQKSAPLDNPLPIPKRHERRKMDYAIELSEYNLDFDIINTKENDDFDIE